MSLFLTSNNVADAFMIKGVYKLPFQILNQDVWITDSIITTCLITIIIMVLAIIGNRFLIKAKEIPTGVQNFIELLCELLNNMTNSIFGANSIRFRNYIGTIFIFILFSNLSGVFGLRAPTADYGVTFLLGLFTFCITQFQGFKNKGVGNITDLFKPTPVLFPINLIGEIANPISISLRLFANMLSGVIIMGLWYSTLLPLWTHIAIPSALHAYCDLFSGCIQTYVVCMLTMVYVNDKL